MSTDDKDKFEFDTDFQENLLQYTVTDKAGYRALGLYEDHNFTLIEHQVIASAIKDYFKRKKRVPQSKTILREHLRKILMSRDFANALSTEDKTRINKIAQRIYRGPVKDPEEILEAALRFARYVRLKDEVEEVNLSNIDQYDAFADRVRKAITIGVEFKQEAKISLVEGIRDRQYKRKTNDEIIPTPIRQINQYTNGGGWARGAVVVVMGPEKEFKTGFLINLSRQYLRVRRKTLYVDFENGQDNLATRLEQSIMNKSKKEILSGLFDEKVQKQLRKYKRLKAEVDIKRFPSYTTNCNHLQAYIDEQYRDEGVKYDEIIIDRPTLMGAISGTQEEENRIAQVFVELKNLTEHNKFNTCWVAAHTTRKAEIRFGTRFFSSDIAQCMDITRTVDAIFGYNRSELDIKLGVARLEIVDQRDGAGSGAALFKVNYANQRCDELSKQEVDIYYKNVKSGEAPVKRQSDLTDN